MSLYEINHNGTPEEVKEHILKMLDELGYGKYVTWNSFSFSAHAPIILNLKGHITDQMIVVEKSSGALGTKVLNECKTLLYEKFGR